MRLISVLFALAALAACDRANTPEPKPAPPSIEVKEVAAADAYGEPGETVNDVAFWSHPSINFQGLLIAATDRGVSAFSIETGAQAGEIASGATDAVEVFYRGTAAAAAGYVLAARGGQYDLYAIDNATAAISKLTPVAAIPAANEFCVGRSGDVVTLYEVGDGSLTKRTLSIDAGGSTFSDAAPAAPVAGVASCHVDERTGDVITLDRDGAIKRIDPATGESFGLAFVSDKAPDSSTLFLTTQEGAEKNRGGVIAALNGPDGVITLIDETDGHALGAVRIKATFELEAVASATSIAAGFGNYGGVYRDGALAVVTRGDGAPIRLAPWNGVLSALGLPLGVTVDPRTPQPAVEVDSVLSIDFEEP